MSGELKDGGQAFPTQRVTHTHASASSPLGPSVAVPVYEQMPGMTLRDWFAGQALAGLFNHEGWMMSADCDELAGRSYSVADAMIAARSK